MTSFQTLSKIWFFFVILIGIIIVKSVSKACHYTKRCNKSQEVCILKKLGHDVTREYILFIELHKGKQDWW